jgi:DNA-nicking Smr family endonuclease
MVKVRSLAELVHVRDALQRQAREAAERAAQERAAIAAAERQRRLFADTVGPVTPMAPDDRAALSLPRPAPEPRQRELDEQAALAEAMSDEVDIESLLLTDDGLSFRREGVSPEVVTRLRRGHWSIQSEIDLHGLRRDEAREALAAFVRGAAARGHRCLRVVHGKGHGSPGKQPVLKGKVQRWLGQSATVIAFAQASGPQGGAGALIVLLVGHVRDRGNSRDARNDAQREQRP